MKGCRMLDDGFRKVCKMTDLREKEGRRFIVDDVDVAIFILKGKVYAVSNICPHQHAAVIYDGFIEEGCVVCPAHGWMFDLETGKSGGEKKGLDTYPVQVIDNSVYVKVFKKELNW